MLISVKEIAWIAGLLEGEGSFIYDKSTPSIAIQMNDLDIIERFKFITKGKQKIYIRNDIREIRKQSYSFRLSGTIAIEWMMTIYCLMGVRRKAKIREILFKHQNKQAYGFGPYAKTPQQKLLEKMKEFGFTPEEAEKVLLERMAKIT